MWDNVLYFLTETKSIELCEFFGEMEATILSFDVDYHYSEIINAFSVLSEAGNDYVYGWIEQCYLSAMRRLIQEHGIVMKCDVFADAKCALAVLQTIKEIQSTERYDEVLAILNDEVNSIDKIADIVELLVEFPMEETLDALISVDSKLIGMSVKLLTDRLEVFELLTTNGDVANNASALTKLPYFNGSVGHELIKAGLKSNFDLYTILDIYMEDNAESKDYDAIAKNILILVLLSSTKMEEWLIEMSSYLTEMLETEPDLLSKVEMHFMTLYNDARGMIDVQ